ncbi:hypothetical protein PHET_07847 [Paragonimus heterotremus]|uniref:Uncharacterized protein n=1 Tax=Paragonimus heterotremus TaxID=100268 RepID=A0A8J4WFK8_9TREM|nr:hypothetical protein PHET_07847 [Paragonimus heterotremus]
MSGYPPFTIADRIQPQLEQCGFYYDPNSSFCTQDWTNAVFNFTGTHCAPPEASLNVPFGQRSGRCSLRDKRKAEIIPGSDADVPPLKLRISETAMSNHFAGMSLTNPPDGHVSSGISSYYEVCPTVVDEGSMGSSFALPCSLGDEESKEADNVPTFEMSTCLKDHLKEYPPDCSNGDVMRKILVSKPSLALVPYDPSCIPPSFRPKTESIPTETEEETDDEAIEPLSFSTPLETIDIPME